MEASFRIGLSPACASFDSAASSDASMLDFGGHLKRQAKNMHAYIQVPMQSCTLLWIWMRIREAHILWRQQAIIPEESLSAPCSCLSNAAAFSVKQQDSFLHWRRGYHLTLTDDIPDDHIKECTRSQVRHHTTDSNPIQKPGDQRFTMQVSAKSMLRGAYQDTEPMAEYTGSAQNVNADVLDKAIRNLSPSASTWELCLPLELARCEIVAWCSVERWMSNACSCKQRSKLSIKQGCMQHRRLLDEVHNHLCT